MSQHPSHDLIGITDVSAKLPQFISILPNLLSGLNQSYSRTPNTPAVLGIAFEKPVKRNPHGMALLFHEQHFIH